MTESRHAGELRRLGFQKIDGMTISNNERKRRLRSGDVPQPSYTQTRVGDASVTYATDDKWQSWMAAGHIDLTALGFRDTTELVRDHLDNPPHSSALH